MSALLNLIPATSPLTFEETYTGKGEIARIRTDAKQVQVLDNGGKPETMRCVNGYAMPSEFYLQGRGTKEQATLEVEALYFQVIRDLFYSVPFCGNRFYELYYLAQTVRKDLEFTSYIDPVYGPSVFASAIIGLAVVPNRMALKDPQLVADFFTPEPVQPS